MWLARVWRNLQNAQLMSNGQANAQLQSVETLAEPFYGSADDGYIITPWLPCSKTSNHRTNELVAN